MKKAISFLVFMIPLFCVAQNPSYLSIAISDSTARGVLRGTLTLPMGSGAVPLILMVPGSGPTDRDGNNAMGISTNCTKMMAEGLAAQKIASLRFDKRGVAKSAAAAMSEEKLRFDDYVTDVKEWIALLRKDSRVGKIIICGHSEGSLVGMIACQEQRADGFISLAGAGRPIDVILNEQVAKNPANPESIKKEVAEILTKLKAGNTMTDIPPYLTSLFRASVQPYLISWIRYDPAVEIAKLKCPVMIIQGTTDIQVSLADAEALKAASSGALYTIIEGMNHVLKPSTADLSVNMATYANKDLPLHENLLPAMTKFIKTIR